LYDAIVKNNPDFLEGGGALTIYKYTLKTALKYGNT
jgi:hypothetical protein